MSRQNIEESVSATLRNRGFTVSKGMFIGEGLFGEQLRADVFVKGVPDYSDGLILELRSQSVLGTTDEKLPYIILNIKEKYSHPTVLLVEGKGYRPAAVYWAGEQVGGNLVAVHDNIKDLMNWIKSL